VSQRCALAVRQDRAVGRKQVCRHFLGRCEAGPLDPIGHVQVVDELFDLRQVSHVGRVAGTHLAAHHQQARRRPAPDEFGQAAHQRFAALVGIEKSEIGQQPCFGACTPPGTLACPVILLRHLAAYVAANRDGPELFAQPGCIEPLPIRGIRDH